MPRASSKVKTGFVLGMQAHAARCVEGKRREKAKPRTLESWWIGVPREAWAAKCAEVFPEIAASKEGQRAFRPWKDPVV